MSERVCHDTSPLTMSPAPRDLSEQPGPSVLRGLRPCRLSVSGAAAVQITVVLPERATTSLSLSVNGAILSWKHTERVFPLRWHWNFELKFQYKIWYQIGSICFTSHQLIVVSELMVLKHGVSVRECLYINVIGWLSCQQDNGCQSCSQLAWMGRTGKNAY